MAQVIEHTGIVERTEGETVVVRIAAQSACRDCRAREACGMTESQEKRIEVETPEAASYAAGDAVTVGVYRHVAGMAVLLGYGGSMAVLILALVLCTQLFGLSEGASALISIAAVALYYGGLWLFRKRMREIVRFIIRKHA